MDYQNTLKYLYESTPMFQQIGGKAYKPGLDTTYKLDEYFGHPHQQFKTIHIAGTNGKGSCAHTIAAVLQSAGYRVGLFTSPHLLDFRERIRINGEMIPEEYVIRFVEEHRAFFEPLHPSFFELTTAMAFRYFADQQVEVAVIETGMGGRLDCTNIIRPDVSVITNIDLDHTQYLGDTLTKIAKEKAGIIKERVPAVVGAVKGSVKRVFTLKAKEMNAPLLYAQEVNQKAQMDTLNCSELHALRLQLEQQPGSDDNASAIQALNHLIEEKKNAIRYQSADFPNGLFAELSSICQYENIPTILTALHVLKGQGYHIRTADYYTGFANVCRLTGLMGRWQKMHSHPDIICDTGHNVNAFKSIRENMDTLHEQFHKELHIVFGMVNDKDVSGVLRLLPPYATYYFTKASVKRALPENELALLAEKARLKGNTYPTVTEAVEAAKKNCLPEDVIFIGGSNFIIADLLANSNTLNFD